MSDPVRRFSVGIDIGGTCTDCVVLDPEGDVVLGKALSTPPDFVEGIEDSIASAAAKLSLTVSELLVRSSVFLHSTTVAENALVDGNVASVGLLTTEGFRHTLWATRGGYGRWFGLTDDELKDPVGTNKPTPLVPLHLVEGIKERVDVQGSILVPVSVREVRDAVAKLQAAGAETLAICFLWSFVNSENERMAEEEARSTAPGMFSTSSNEVAPTIGEYERTSTTVLNAMLGPTVRSYLTDLEQRLSVLGFEGQLFVMQAYGGLVDLENAKARPVGLIESGPVSGLTGSARLGKTLGNENVIAADMGGTTFKIGTVREGLIDYQRESAILRYHLSVPKLDVVSLGIAGGSVVSVDPVTNTPTIGPRSAGSFPGPACYGNGGGEPTVTDVDGILGFLNEEFFLEGSKSLDLERARDVFEKQVATPLQSSVEEAAAAIYRLTNSLIYDFLHKTTVQRGLDPRSFALVSTGGTAGMHLPAVGAQLGVAEVIVPHSASVHGAYGLVTSDVALEEMTTRPMPYEDSSQSVRRIIVDLTSTVLERLRRVGNPGDDIRLEWMVDMRFKRQVHILTVPLWSGRTEEAPEVDGGLLAAGVDRFENMYLERYGPGSAYREAGVELVAFRVRCSRPLGHRTQSHQVPEDEAVKPADEHRWSLESMTGEFRRVPCYDFDKVESGGVLMGPAIIWTPITTVVLGEGQRAVTDGSRNLRVTTAQEGTTE